MFVTFYLPKHGGHLPFAIFSHVSSSMKSINSFILRFVERKFRSYATFSFESVAICSCTSEIESIQNISSGHFSNFMEMGGGCCINPQPGGTGDF